YYFVPSSRNHRSGKHFSPAGYIQAVWRACDEAKVGRWYPHRLRHTAATFIRKEFDVETARIILGHSSLKVTEIYAERDENLALAAMQRVG
ncbi:MAG: tyrosine-type recombinase/integrase, partial [Planctomycetaceae bacterium]